VKEDNEAVIKALNMYGRVPEQYELLNEIERLNNIINELEKTLLEWHEYWEYDDSYSWQYKNAYDYIQELKGSVSNE
jgi:hypothetical protein